MTSSEFRGDLYTGTADYYERFRLPYPPELIDGLATRCGAAGTGRLLDLACGTGQLCFALHDRFAETWAVDQEPEMIEVARDKAVAAGMVDIRFLTSAAEQLSAPDSWFDLVAIGNAFHRLRRDTVAVSVHRWLLPGAFLALVWSDSPWAGDAPWQHALAATLRRWTDRAETRGRVPAGYDADRVARPDQAILQDSGFQLVGRYEFAVQRFWTLEELTGFMASTSVLSRPALGDLAVDFYADLERELSCACAGKFHQVVRFAYDLARRSA